MIEKPAINKAAHGISTKQALADLTPEFFNEAICRMWLIKNLHPDGAKCPACKTEITEAVQLARFNSGKRLHCKQCGKWYSAFSGTLFQECQLDERRIYILALLTELNLHKNEIARVLNINPATVRIWQAKFRAAQDAQHHYSELEQERDVCGQYYDGR